MRCGISDRIRIRRIKLGMTQRELAKRVGVSRQTIQAIEYEKSDRTRFLPDIAEVLGCSVEWLVYGTEKHNDN